MTTASAVPCSIRQYAQKGHLLDLTVDTTITNDRLDPSMTGMDTIMDVHRSVLAQVAEKLSQTPDMLASRKTTLNPSLSWGQDRDQTVVFSRPSSYIPTDRDPLSIKDPFGVEQKVAYDYGWLKIKDISTAMEGNTQLYPVDLSFLSAAPNGSWHKVYNTSGVLVASKEATDALLCKQTGGNTDTLKQACSADSIVTFNFLPSSGDPTVSFTVAPAHNHQVYEDKDRTMILFSDRDDGPPEGLLLAAEKGGQHKFEWRGSVATYDPLAEQCE